MSILNQCCATVLSTSYLALQKLKQSLIDNQLKQLALLKDSLTMLPSINTAALSSTIEQANDQRWAGYLEGITSYVSGAVTGLMTLGSHFLVGSEAENEANKILQGPTTREITLEEQEEIPAISSTEERAVVQVQARDNEITTNELEDSTEETDLQMAQRQKAENKKNEISAEDQKKVDKLFEKSQASKAFFNNIILPMVQNMIAGTFKFFQSNHQADSIIKGGYAQLAQSVAANTQQIEQSYLSTIQSQDSRIQGVDNMLNLLAQLSGRV